MPLAIPCHRVVPSTLKVENYGMPGRKPSEGVHVKRQLLMREGVKFKDGNISEESFWSPNRMHPEYSAISTVDCLIGGDHYYSATEKSEQKKREFLEILIMEFN
jgi:hypothetical protein